MSEAGTDYTGPERRQGNLQLDEALAEVQRLHNAATTLANAVTHTATRHELEELRAQVTKERWIMLCINSALTAIIILFLIIFFTVKMNNQSKAMKIGHEIITCMQGKTEAQRTGDLAGNALVTCEQRAK